MAAKKVERSHCGNRKRSPPLYIPLSHQPIYRPGLLHKSSSHFMQKRERNSVLHCTSQCWMAKVAWKSFFWGSPTHLLSHPPPARTSPGAVRPLESCRGPVREEVRGRKKPGVGAGICPACCFTSLCYKVGCCQPQHADIPSGGQAFSVELRPGGGQPKPQQPLPPARILTPLPLSSLLGTSWTRGHLMHL